MKLPIKEYILLLSNYMKKQRNQLLLLLVVLISSIAVQLINPQIIRFFIDNATKGSNTDNKLLTISAIIFIVAAFVVQLLNLAATYLSQNIGWKATNNLRVELIAHCLHLDMDFHKNHQAGELIERVDGDVNSLFNFFSKFMLNVFNNVILLIGILVLLTVENPIVGLCLSTFAFIAMLVLWLIQSKTSDVVVEYRQQQANMFGFIGEQVSSTEDIRSNGATHYVMESFYHILKKILPLKVKSAMNYYNMWSSTLFIFAVGNAITFGLSAYLWKQGTITIGTVYLIFYYTELLVRPIEMIRRELQDLQKATASIKRIKELFELKSSLMDGERSVDISTAIEVKLQNVSFSYDQSENALNDITLDIGKGNVVGVIGHSGSGKTTLARLLVRLYDATTGEILLNGTNIKDIKFSDLRKHIAYVTQDVQLFKASVRDNLTMFNKAISDKSIMDAISSFGLDDWYQSLSEGLDTMIEASGTGLSAGEAQLLAFVRVFLKKPSLIILDEATSRLDPITEQLIEKALDKLTNNRTCIIIAHRLWTVKRADQILIIEKGRIAEFGDAQDLSNNQASRFFKLLQTGIEEVLV